MARNLKVKLVVLAAAVSLALQIGVVEASHAGAAPAPPAQGSTAKAGGVSSGELQRAIAQLSSGATPSAPVESAGSALRVEVVHHLTDGAARQLVQSLGGQVEGSVPGVLVQALVPYDRVATLEANPGVDVVRPPLDVSEPVASDPVVGTEPPPEQAVTVVGQEVAKTNASSWQAAGITGAGVKIGIVDSFSSTAWNAAVGAGEIENPAGTFCIRNGAACDIWASGSTHGEGVAEIIHEMAPGATLYLANVTTASDLQAAVNYFVGQGVKIISRSETARYDGPGDGTGPIASVMNNAVANGITWFNAAGNAAGATGVRNGSYWRGSWRDTDADGFLEFATTGDELMGVNCGYVNGLRWSDWAASGRTDYDVYVYDTPTSPAPEVTSVDNQGTGALPLEVFNLSCNASNDTDYLAIKLFNGVGGGTAGDVLEFMINGTGLEYWQNPYSAAAPQADTASPGGLAIGAIDPAAGTTIATYSSQGPTNDNRIKPDISVASCVSSFTYAASCFNGTSAATPGIAGAAALVLQSGAATSPSTLKTYLLNASVDRGVAGADNVYGRGELVLPAPPGPANNAFANAAVISGASGSTAGSNVGATKQTGEPNHAGFTGGASIWYRWTAPATGFVNLDTVGSSFDTLLGVYTGSSVSALTTVASNDDVSTADQTSRVRFRATAGTTYQIAVDGYAAATGSVGLRWAMPNTAPVASAGLDRSVNPGTTVTLDGSASLDTDGGPLTYRWIQISGPPAVLNDDRAVRPQFVASSQHNTTVTFQLTVTDDTGRTATDDVTIRTK